MLTRKDAEGHLAREDGLHALLAGGLNAAEELDELLDQGDLEEQRLGHARALGRHVLIRRRQVHLRHPALAKTQAHHTSPSAFLR